MAFGFFKKRRKNSRGAKPEEHSAISGMPQNSSIDNEGASSDAASDASQRHGESLEQLVEQDSTGMLTPSDFFPDATLPQLNRSRANLLRRELEYRFALHDAHIDIDGNSAMIKRSDGGSAHVSLRTLAMNAAGLDNMAQLPDLVESFVHGTLADATLNDISTADLYLSLIHI